MKPHQRKPLTSFILFCILISKDVLVADFKLIPVRGRFNMLISYFIILPCIIVGITFALQYLWQKYIQKKYPGENWPDWGTLLCMPMVVYFITITFMIVTAFIRIYLS